MILKWIQSVSRAVETKAAEQGEAEDRKARRDSKLIDLPHEVLSERAARDRDTLDTLVRLGWPHVIRERFKGKVRKKVWEVVSDEAEVADPDMVEDITERIVDAAEVDQYYRKMFGGDES
ncbi:MAG: hypothetical protein V2A66_09750 [Pseudomonadota bacterium]